MTTNTSELRVEFDVDDTLVMHGTPCDYPVELNYYGIPKQLAIHWEHVQLLKSYKARGYHITVQSANGQPWVAEVVDKLRLESFVDHIQAKAIKVVDDKEVGEAFGQRVYIPYREKA